MKRRCVLIGLALTAPIWAAAQDASRVPRIGFLGNSSPELEANLVQPFRDGLRELGYVNGQSIFVEYRWAEGDYARLPELVAELVAAKVLLIATAGTPAALAVKKSAPTLPLVMIAIGDPVGTGLAQSLAHPGGNLTGLATLGPEMAGGGESVQKHHRHTGTARSRRVVVDARAGEVEKFAAHWC